MAADGLRHEAVVYCGEEGFVAGVLPYVEEGLEQGEPVLAVTTPANAAALRDALGPRAGPLDVRDSREWYRLPGATLTAYGRYVERRGGGRRVRIVGEPVWHGLSAAATREWMRYEWVLNRAFRSTAVSIVCPYDACALPPGVVAGACRTHPLVAGGGPASLAAPSELAPAAGPGPPPGAETLAPLRTAAEARRLAERRARAAGLPDERVGTFVLAVSELAANALEHGRPPAELAVWREGPELVARVRDGGPGVDDPFRGWEEPPLDGSRGRGLWLARQLCEVVELARDRDGAAALLRVTV